MGSTLSSGSTGGTLTHNHFTGFVYDESGTFGIDTKYVANGPMGGGDWFYSNDYGSRTATMGGVYTESQANIPPYYELVFFIKVK